MKSTLLSTIILTILMSTCKTKNQSYTEKIEVKKQQTDNQLSGFNEELRKARRFDY